MNKPIDKNITMPASFWQKLEQLANGNADGTRGRMLVMLTYLAAAMPEEFGIFPPGDNKGSHPEVDRRSTGEGYGERVNISMLQNDWDAVQRLANTNTKGYKSTLLRHLIVTAHADPERFNLYPPSDVPVYRDGVTVSAEMRERISKRNRHLTTDVADSDSDDEKRGKPARQSERA
jgi:hypothetical protein